MDRESLWFRVLSTRYGVEGGRVLDSGRDVSTWWRDIAALRREGWFSNHVSRSVGNGSVAFFGWMCRPVVSRLESGLEDYLIWRCVRRRMCLICVN